MEAIITLEQLFFQNRMDDFLSGVVKQVAQIVYKRFFEPTVNKGINVLKKKYYDQIRPKLDENIRDTLDTFIRDIEKGDIVDWLNQQYNILVEKIRDKVCEFVPKSLKRIQLLNKINNLTENYNVNLIDITNARCPVIVMLDVLDDDNGVDYNYILSNIIRSLKNSISKSDDGSMPDITVCSYDELHKPVICQGLIPVKNYGEKVYSDISGSNGEIISFAYNDVYPHLESFYKENSILRICPPVFIYITKYSLCSDEVKKCINAMKKRCKQKKYSFYIVDVEAAHRNDSYNDNVLIRGDDEYSIADSAVKIICKKLGLIRAAHDYTNESIAENFTDYAVQIDGAIYAEDLCARRYPNQRCPYSLVLDLKDPDADVGKTVFWQSFYKVYRLKETGTSNIDFSDITIEHSVLSECASRNALGYRVKVSGKTMLMKLLLCADAPHAEKVLKYYTYIFKKDGCFGTLYDEKLIITNEKVHRYFAVIFMEYPDENSWMTLREFIEQEGYDYTRLSIMQRCSIVYQVAYIAKNLMYGGLIGGKLTRNNVYISKEWDRTDKNIPSRYILIGGLGLPSNDAHINNRALKDLLCFCLTASYGCEREKLRKLPCSPVLRKYFSGVCEQYDEVSFFGYQYTHEQKSFKLIYDKVVKCNNHDYDFEQLCKSGIRYITVSDINTGSSYDCTNYIYTPEDNFPVIKFYPDEDNHGKVVKVYADNLDASNKVIVSYEGNKVNLTDVESLSIYNNDVIEFAVTALFGKRTKKVKISKIEWV